MEPRRDGIQHRTDGGNLSNKRMTGMVLNPLAEVGVGMFMPVVVRRRQVVMNGQRSRKRRDRYQEERQCNRDRCAGVGSAKHG